jgi:pyruvate dehydrogenase E1 component alpha subunit
LEKGLRAKEELDYWMSRCPIKALEEFLLTHNMLSEAEKSEICRRVNDEVEEAVTFARQSPFPAENELLNNLFKT